MIRGRATFFWSLLSTKEELKSLKNGGFQTVLAHVRSVTDSTSKAYEAAPVVVLPFGGVFHDALWSAYDIRRCGLLD